ncbi:MAG: hypothetical protein SFU56_11155 [Capsulimonadales bacterium]|nr:hypothetical protein [Capsulimonadales bacterium]
MRDFVVQWVSLCESLCAPERIVRSEECSATDTLRTPADDRQFLVVRLTGDSADSPVRTLHSVFDIALNAGEIKGVLRDRTMYVVVFCDPTDIDLPGVLVTDSPGRVRDYQKRYETATAWTTLGHVNACTVTLDLAFPAFRESFAVMQGVVRRTADTVPPDLLTVAPERQLTIFERESRFIPAFATAYREVKRREETVSARTPVGV